MTDLLRLHAVSIKRAGALLLAGIDLTLSPGQAVVVMGPNGIGKTSLLRCVAGLTPVADGQRMAADLAFLPHSNGVKPTLSVVETLTFWAGLYGHRIIEPALSAMDLGRIADRPGAELSAGQCRRVALARLVLSGAPLWVMDEPTVGLDAASVALFGAMVRHHLAAGGAALIASHADDLVGAGASVLTLTPHRLRAAAIGAGR